MFRILAQKIFFLFIACCLLTACGNDSNAEKPIEQKKDEKIELKAETSANAPADAQQPAKMDRATADRILQFHNHATEELTNGYYSLALKIAAIIGRYQKEWTLPQKLPVPPRRSSLFTPPSGVFDKESEKTLSDTFKNMDQTLRGMVADYHKLEAYVADKNIKDDGKRGNELAAKLLAANDVYMAARKSWQEIVDAKAAQAEAELLADYPLRRQAIAARDILAVISQVSDLMTADSLNRQVLGSLLQSLEKSIGEGEKPPFPASSSLERLYRGFLKNARVYAESLKRCEQEGDFVPQRRELNAAAQACRDAYNNFAKAVNSSR